MKIINIGATCDTCAKQGQKKGCKPCLTRNGRPGWEPAPGVQVIYGEDWRGNVTRRPVREATA